MIDYNPRRRLHLYPNGETLEVLILGDVEAVASMHVFWRQMLEAWRGWRNITAIGMGSAIIGLRASLSPEAKHTDVLAEALRMLQSVERVGNLSLEIAWRQGPEHVGWIATW